MKMESKIFEASHFTRILWLEAMKLRAAEQSRYHIVKVYHYLKKPNIKSLRRAVQLITANNYNLRSYFVESKGKIKQNILNHLPVSLKLLQAHSKEEFKTKLNQLIEKPFRFSARVLHEGSRRRFNTRFTKVLGEGSTRRFLPKTQHGGSERKLVGLVGLPNLRENPRAGTPE